MDLNDRDRAILNDLINIAWLKGAVTSPQMAQELEILRAKITTKEKKECSTDAKAPNT